MFWFFFCDLKKESVLRTPIKNLPSYGTNRGKVYFLVISERKLDGSFPTGQFKDLGYASPFRLNQNRNDGGIMVFVREDIPVKLLSTKDKPIEAFFFELSFHKKK